MNFVIVLLILSLLTSTEQCGVTSHAVCLRDDSLISCFLVGTNVTEIEDTISECSRESNYTELEINLKVSNTNFVLAMDLPESITLIEVAGTTVANSSLQLTADRPHGSIIEVKVLNAVILLTEDTRNMFDIFPNIERIVCEGCTFSMLPSLIALSSLDSIEYSGNTQCDQGNIVHIDDLFVRGLEAITLIKWSAACVGSVSETAFRDLVNLEKLDLSRNEITDLPDEVFLTLYKVVTIDLFDNNISTISTSAFQQLHNIETISLTDNPLKCSCENSWLYLVEKELNFKISVSDCENGNPFNDPSNYVNCTETLPHCFNRSAQCEYKCENRADEFECVCKTGYKTENVTVCVDANECLEDTHDCEQICSNTIGSYTCSCNTGYRLNSTRTCQDIDECIENTHGCKHNCSNTIGSYECSCNTGYRLNGTRTCQDIDECIENTHGCEQACNNTIGSYECDCNTGYQLLTNGTCRDIDECTGNTHGCEQVCSNIIGSYECDCNTGYQLNGTRTCQDINECDFNNGGCTHDCLNLYGGFRCTCRDGFLQDSSDSFLCVEPLTGSDNAFPPILVALAVILVILFILGVTFIISVIVAIVISHSRKKSARNFPQESAQPPPPPIEETHV